MHVDQHRGRIPVAQMRGRTQRGALRRDGRDQRSGSTGGEYPGEKHFRHDLNTSRGYSHASRSEEHTSELQSLMRISYAVFCLKKKKYTKRKKTQKHTDD